MCMYSEHGFDALMRPVFGQVCQRLIVVSYCMPGSPQSQVASEISRSSSRALRFSSVSPVVTARRCQSPLASEANMNSSVTRTELLAFWNWIDCQASPFMPMS